MFSQASLYGRLGGGGRSSHASRDRSHAGGRHPTGMLSSFNGVYVVTQVMERDGLQQVHGVMRALQSLFTLPPTPHGYTTAALLRSITPEPLINQLLSVAFDKVGNSFVFKGELFLKKQSKSRLH